MTVLTAVARGLANPPLASRRLEHVRYVTDETGSGAAVDFLLGVLSDPFNAALFAAGAAAVLLVLAGYLRYRPAARDVAVLRGAFAEYEDYLPWMLRLSVGLPLVGAGFAGYFFSPAVPIQARVFQVGVGFLLLFGLATRAVAAVGLVGYLVGFVVAPDLFLAVEYVGGFVAVLLLGGGRPSADHMLTRVADAPGTLYGRFDPVHRVAVRFRSAVAPYEQYAPTVVRVVLGVAFVILGFWEKLAHPAVALAVVAKYDLTAVVPVDPGVWVLGAALVEIAVGLCLVAGLFTRAVAAVAFLTLTTTLFGLPDDPVLAHVTLFGLTSALFVTGAGPLSLDRRLHAAAGWAETATPG